ncbi:hypothetical protein FA375_03570 [Pseudomonas aeruginosa]|nr:hypothetical protein [Pseudomonas aeruginosa]MCO2255529.1 hypothetical protein [Pseudomonas aeruginosa]MCO3075613.1 hypothetical protein [Pseudomonas aeruginosa]
MAYLNTEEIKALETAPVSAKLLYIFSSKLRAKNGTVDYGAIEDGYQVMTDDLEGLHHPDTMERVDAEAVKQRLSSMIDRKIITPTDKRKILKLLKIYS